METSQNMLVYILLNFFGFLLGKQSKSSLAALWKAACLYSLPATLTNRSLPDRNEQVPNELVLSSFNEIFLFDYLSFFLIGE